MMQMLVIAPGRFRLQQRGHVYSLRACGGEMRKDLYKLDKMTNFATVIYETL